MPETERRSHELETARHFKASFSADDGEYGAGTWYGEFVDGIARRQFEVYEGRTAVAPFDIKFADQYESILNDKHYREISSEEFEAAWRQHAQMRLRQLGRSDSHQ